MQIVFNRPFQGRGRNGVQDMPVVRSTTSALRARIGARNPLSQSPGRARQFFLDLVRIRAMSNVSSFTVHKSPYTSGTGGSGPVVRRAVPPGGAGPAGARSDPVGTWRLLFLGTWLDPTPVRIARCPHSPIDNPTVKSVAYSHSVSAKSSGLPASTLSNNRCRTLSKRFHANRDFPIEPGGKKRAAESAGTAPTRTAVEASRGYSRAAGRALGVTCVDDSRPGRREPIPPFPHIRHYWSDERVPVSDFRQHMKARTKEQ
jgi:hypothetical protein